MQEKNRRCPECDRDSDFVTRRGFLRTVGAGAVAAGAWIQETHPEEPGEPKTPETAVKRLYGSLTDRQRKEVCFAWDYLDPRRGLLRTRVANNWQITPHAIKSDFYTRDQQQTVREIFEGIVQPAWRQRIDRQLKDDAGGFGVQQSIAIFGHPGSGKFEFVLTGRHVTLRCDGHSAPHEAFGGPIFYGHAASGFNEKPDHPGNVYWPQALAANEVFKMLDGKQQKQAVIARAPEESAIAFRGPQGSLPGIPVKDLSRDQKALVQKTLEKLIEPYRPSDREGVLTCLKVQGGLDHCGLAFYQEGDLGNDRVWDIWRLEGPALVWHFRGAPHVHVWAHVADDPSVNLNA